MVDLEWCKKQSRGVSLVDRNLNLSGAYFKDAYDTLKVCLNSEGKWKVITGYYACYNAFYAVLMKCGIKSEIHECTIRLMGLFDFSSAEIEFIENLKRDRIQGQYYLKDANLEDVSSVKNFVLKCEEISDSLNQDKITELRGRLR